LSYFKEANLKREALEKVAIKDAEYYGQIRHYRPHGEGSMKWPEGFEYKGLWRNGKKHGKGVLSFPDGKKF